MIKFRVLVFDNGSTLKDFIDDGDFIIIQGKDIKSDECSASKYSADAVIIDMSCFNKTDVFKYVADNSETYIFVVNADENLKYQIYECGAADVMTGLVDKIELSYKIHIAITKNKYKPKRYLIGDLMYEAETGTLLKDDRSIVLPTLQNKIFTLLLNGYYDNRIVKKDEVFTSMIDESSRIQNHIARLRYSLTYIKSRQVVIETIYGKGYKLLVIEK